MERGLSEAFSAGHGRGQYHGKRGQRYDLAAVPLFRPHCSFDAGGAFRGIYRDRHYKCGSLGASHGADRKEVTYVPEYA